MFANGWTSWTYQLVSPDYAKHIPEEQDREYSWSDKYRRTEYEIIENPPEKWVSREIEHVTLKISGLQKALTMLKEQQSNANTSS